MRTVTIKGCMVGYHFSHMKPTDPIVWGFCDGDSGALGDSRVATFKHSFDIEVPEHVDMIGAMTANLEAAKLKALEDYQRTVAELNDRLSKLQALTHEVAA